MTPQNNELSEADRKAIDAEADYTIHDAEARYAFRIGAEWGIKHARAELMGRDDYKAGFTRGVLNEKELVSDKQAERIAELEAELEGLKNNYRVACKEIDDRQAEVARLQGKLSGQEEVTRKLYRDNLKMSTELGLAALQSKHTPDQQENFIPEFTGHHVGSITSDGKGGLKIIGSEETKQPLASPLADELADALRPFTLMSLFPDAPINEYITRGRAALAKYQQAKQTKE